MYANLLVTYELNGTVHAATAYKIDMDVAGRHVLHLEAENDYGELEPRGSITLHHEQGDALLTVVADY